MASLRRVRKSFRKEVLRAVSTGDGTIETLINNVAGKHFGRDVGYEDLIKSFLGTEVSHALAYLRSEGLVESVGKKWIPAAELTAAESTVVSTRRWKRLRGELKSEVRFAHEHGLMDEATKAAELLAMTSVADSEHVDAEANNVQVA